jgi:PAS domain S-box-containing protein
MARWGYPLAVVLVLAALLGRFALVGALPPTGFPFLTFFPAVVLAALLGGLGPGLLASVLSIAAAKYFFVPATGGFAFATPADVIALGFFAVLLLFDCVVIHFMTANLRRARQERARADDLSAAQRSLAAELSEGEARYRLALEAGRMGTWDWDLAADRMFWNGRQFELFGLDPASGPPAGEAVLAQVHPEDRPGLQAAIAEAIAQGEGVFEHEFRLLLPDGRQRWIAGHGRAVPGPDGRAARMVGLNIDVSARRTAEELLAREAEKLEQLAEQRARALAATEARLAEAARMEALGRLAGGIAHDFNNVLQAVGSGLALAARRLPAEPEAAQRFIDLSIEAVGRGSAVTGRLLSFARRDALRAEPIGVPPLLAGLVEMLRHTIGPEITLHAEAADDLPRLLADRGQLEAVLVNLANNARDAMPRGGLLVFRAALAEPAGDPAAPPRLGAGPYLRLSVVDRGEGMTPEVLARVSEPFFTTKPPGRGTGLGLAMARGFAEQSGGGLSIESAPGQGTTVSLWLPRAPAEAEAPSPPRLDAERLAALPGGAASVLLVEDEPTVRTVLAAELEDAGYRVTAVDDGAAALFLLDRGFRPDLLVSDLAMPGGLDGLELVAAARARLPGLPSLLVTGRAGAADAGRLAAARAGGPFEVLRKPLPRNLLARALGALLPQEAATP